MLTVFLEVQSDTLWQALPDGRLYIPLSRTTSLSDAQLGWLSNGSQWISLELYVVGVQQLSFSKACFYMQLSYLLVTYDVAWFVREVKLGVLELKLVH